MNVIFVTPLDAEQLVTKGVELCNNDDLYVVLTSQKFSGKENVRVPQNAKIVYFSIYNGIYSKAYVCNNGNLEVRYNYDMIEDYYYYYNKVLIVELFGSNIPLSSLIYKTFLMYGLKIGDRKTYILNVTDYNLFRFLYSTNRRPLFTAFVSEPNDDGYRKVYALKVQDICIIHNQYPSKLNVLVALCGEKPLLWFGSNSNEVLKRTREILNGLTIMKYDMDYFEFSR